MTTAIIDYGSGNLHSAQKAFERAAREAGLEGAIRVTNDPEVVRAADRVVLPGVGAFADCRSGLLALPGLYEALHEAAIDRGQPFLGICVGMQLMAARGLEHGETPGLDWIGGDVVAIAPGDPSLKDSAHGLEHADARADASCLRGNSRRASGVSTPISSTPII